MLLSDHLFKKERLRFFTQATFLVNCLCNERYFHSTSTALIRKYSLVESFRKRKKKFWEYFHYNISTKKKEKKKEESLNVFENGQLKKVASPFKYSGLTVLTQDNFLDSQELYRYISRYRESHNPRPIISCCNEYESALFRNIALLVHIKKLVTFFNTHYFQIKLFSEQISGLTILH